MSWADVGQIAVASIASAGGIGAIMVAVVSFSAKRIADRMDKKFQSTLDQTLEKYKSELSKKEYVSKTKFDTEFSLYRELSVAFSQMIKEIYTLIPSGLTNIPVDEQERLNADKRHYESALPAVVNAQDKLNANIPFIKENIYEGYTELLQLARLQLSEYSDRFVVTDLRPQAEKERFSLDAYRRTKELQDKWKALNCTIRDYISTLDVMEDR